MMAVGDAAGVGDATAVGDTAEAGDAAAVGDTAEAGDEAAVGDGVVVGDAADAGDTIGDAAWAEDDTVGPTVGLGGDPSAVSDVTVAERIDLVWRRVDMMVVVELSYTKKSRTSRKSGRPLNLPPRHVILSFARIEWPTIAACLQLRRTASKASLD